MDSIDERLDAIIASGVPGVAVVALGPTGVVEAASGVADLRTGEPLTADHRFRVGSVTKLFVAPVVLRLVADGLLELDADAVPFVDGITVRQLLNHTSGLPDFVDDVIAFFEPYRRNLNHGWALTPREELRLVMEKQRLFAPGEGWAYRGGNYIVLRLIVEAAAGMSLREVLRQRILAPLGLRRTDLVEAPLAIDCARGYLAPGNPIIPGDGEPVDVTKIDVPFYRAGGGIVSTPAETAQMLRALLQGQLLPADLLAQMLDGVDSDWDETDRYGLGIGEITALMGRRRSPCGPAWGHLGFAVGYTALALSSADGERQVVICANGSPHDADSSNAFWDAAGDLAWNLYCATEMPSGATTGDPPT
jgi:D-alanyl-D-alanine carboxypeptidase